MAIASRQSATALEMLPPICGGALSTSIIMYPADVVRAICMANVGTGVGVALRSFVEAHGMMGFVKQGLVAEMTRASISHATKFVMQPVCHKAIWGKPEAQGTPLTKGIAGALGPIPEVIVSTPLENIKLASQLDKQRQFTGSMDIAKHIVRTRGFSGFMTGYAGMQTRQILWTGGFFMTLDWYKNNVQSVVSHKLAQDVLSGFAAGATGSAFNCWADVSRSVVQKQALADTFNPQVPHPGVLAILSPRPFFRAARSILSSRGIRGLYSGFGPKMIHMGGSGAILAVLMPRLTAIWFDVMKLD
eukprot:TRINITY_DN46126_c0_g1_i1.p1 TRINITY_DN46126_c0_g1~~TRINITY_DN46126_c0_g1_i1.p1  ORF type:complete len:303 (-),score=20.79 TRINITY_DN46126_c0_g1_i1:267-1175(-)